MASLLEIELAKLKNVIIKIGILSENQIVEAMKTLLSDPNATTKNFKKTENKIDKLDVKIDEICMCRRKICKKRGSRRRDRSIFAVLEPDPNHMINRRCRGISSPGGEGF